MLIRGLEKVRKSGNIDDIKLLWVKMRGEDGDSTMALLEYGTRGAKSSF